MTELAGVVLYRREAGIETEVQSTSQTSGRVLVGLQSKNQAEMVALLLRAMKVRVVWLANGFGKITWICSYTMCTFITGWGGVYFGCIPSCAGNLVRNRSKELLSSMSFAAGNYDTYIYICAEDYIESLTALNYMVIVLQLAGIWRFRFLRV